MTPEIARSPLSRRTMLGAVAGSALATGLPLGGARAFAQGTPVAGATPVAGSGAYTINGWGTTDADYAFFNVSRDIEPSADGWQTKAINDDPNVYEWWYFDMQSPNGDNIIVTLSPQATFGFLPRFDEEPKGIASISHTTGGVLRVERAFFSLDQFDAATDHLEVTAGPFTVQGDLDSFHLKGGVNGLEVDVTFTQSATPLRFGNGYIFVGSTDKWEGWFNPYPLARATGTLTVDGAQSEIDASGYHDHDYGNIPIAEGMRGWFWARSVFDRYVTLSNEIQLPARFGGGGVPQFWVYDLQEHKVLAQASTYDDLTITYGEILPHPDPLHGEGYPSLTIYNYHRGEDRILLELADQGVLQGQVEGDSTDTRQWAYLSGLGLNGIYYTRRQSEVTLDLDLPGFGIQDTVTGPALHELEESGFPQYIAPK